MAASLSPAQFSALKKKLEQRAGVDFLSAPTVTTRSGREAQISVEDMMSLVTGMETGEDGRQKPLVENFEAGQRVEIIPTFTAGEWELNVQAQFTEFLGYQMRNASNEKYTRPRTQVRVRSIAASATIEPGWTLVMRTPFVLEKTTAKRGIFHRKETKEVRKRLYLFITCNEKS